MTDAPRTSDKPSLLIVGAGGHGRSVAEAVLMADHFSLVGFADDGAFVRGEAVWGLPVMGPATAFGNYADQSHQMALRTLEQVTPFKPEPHRNPKQPVH